MDGHRAQLHETNNRAWVYVCECGESGIAHPSPIQRNEKTKREVRLVELARDAALKEHAAHVETIRTGEADTAFARMESHAAFMRVAVPTVTRRGRWGRG